MKYLFIIFLISSHAFAADASFSVRAQPLLTEYDAALQDKLKLIQQPDGLTIDCGQELHHIQARTMQDSNWINLAQNSAGRVKITSLDWPTLLLIEEPITFYFENERNKTKIGDTDSKTCSFTDSVHKLKIVATINHSKLTIAGTPIKE
ncbi:MAG TPA: hypothetical protein VFF04_06370 [Candidatus Babeliales bacterium]|nr:hypothetical protein [Candidatus Babeliales bacterium]